MGSECGVYERMKDVKEYKFVGGDLILAQGQKLKHRRRFCWKFVRNLLLNGKS
jgi:hypothetical protein